MANQSKKIIEPVGNTTETSPELTGAKPEVVPAKEAKVVEETTEAVEAETPADVHEGETRIETADGRTLEVSINDKTWVGTVIWVPNDQAVECRRLLTDGNFYIK